MFAESGHQPFPHIIRARGGTLPTNRLGPSPPAFVGPVRLLHFPVPYSLGRNLVQYLRGLLFVDPCPADESRPAACAHFHRDVKGVSGQEAGPSKWI